MTSSGSEEEKNRGVVVDHQHHQYGTFQGVANYPPPASSYPPPRPPHHHHHHHQQPAIGFPQPVPPHGVHGPSVPPPQYYAQGYQTQTVQGYAVAEGRPVREHRLPCCGCGVGWFLFIIGFFLGAIPWYIGLLVLLCGRIDYRERPGYIACTIAAAIATVVIILGATKGADDW